MGKKLKQTEFEEIIKILSKKEQAELNQQEITPLWLEEQIGKRKSLMTRDAYIGVAWFAAYTISLWQAGMNNITVTIFVIGVVYFVYTAFSTGTYGTNKRKVQVYEEILKKLK